MHDFILVLIDIANLNGCIDRVPSILRPDGKFIGDLMGVHYHLNAVTQLLLSGDWFAQKVNAIVPRDNVAVWPFMQY